MEGLGSRDSESGAIKDEGRVGTGRWGADAGVEAPARIAERRADTKTHRFPVGVVKELIREVLQDRLKDQGYQGDKSATWTKEISDEIKGRIKGAWGAWPSSC